MAINFGAGFKDLEVPTGTKYPEARGYVWVITDVINAPSKGGDPMMRFDANIAEGEFTGFYENGKEKRLYQLYGGGKDAEDAKKRGGRMKGLIETIVAENPGLFPEEAIDWENFEEKRLVGCTVGGVLKWDDEGKYTNLAYFCSKERALATEPQDRPERKAEPVVGDNGDGGLF